MTSATALANGAFWLARGTHTFGRARQLTFDGYRERARKLCA